jgi:hypothetical protein
MSAPRIDREAFAVALDRLDRATWDSRVLPSREDVRTLLESHRELLECALIGAGALEELLEHNGDDMGDTRAATLARVNSVIARAQGGAS